MGYTRQQRFHDGMALHRAWSNEETLIEKAYQGLLSAINSATTPIFSDKPIRILDLGAGTGDLGAKLIQQISESHPELPIHYHGLDNDPEYRDAILKNTSAAHSTQATTADIFSPSMLNDLTRQGPWDLVMVNNVGYYALDEQGNFSLDKFRDFINSIKRMSKIAVFVHTPSISNKLETILNEQGAPFDCVACLNCTVPIHSMKNSKGDIRITPLHWDTMEQPVVLHQRDEDPYEDKGMLAFRLVFESRNGALIREWETLPEDLRKQLVGDWRKRVVDGAFHSKERMQIVYGDSLSDTDVSALRDALQQSCLEKANAHSTRSEAAGRTV